jgi:hypothetical protein
METAFGSLHSRVHGPEQADQSKCSELLARLGCVQVLLEQLENHTRLLEKQASDERSAVVTIRSRKPPIT